MQNDNQQLVDSYVDRGVEEFRTNPLCTSLLRRLADELPDRFFSAAMRHVEENRAPEACRFLSNLLLCHPELFEHLADPVLASLQRAVAVSKHLMAFDSSFDIRLARTLPDRYGLNTEFAFTGPRAFRVLDILNEVSRGRRVFPVLGHLVFSGDEKISARVTLFIGRRVKSADWAAQHLRHRDARVRASVVESIWGLRSKTAVGIFEEAAQDESNRVAGNAVLGLHIAGAQGVEKTILDMARNPAAKFRSTAAWVMGRIASPGFAPELSTLLKDKSSMVRSTALRALIEVHRGGSPLVEPEPADLLVALKPI